MVADIPLLFENHDFLSLYVHVPFCAQKCGYCDFYSKATVNGVADFISAFKQEINFHVANNPQLVSKKVSTIFFGGGTPSILTPDQWVEVATAITNSFSLADDCEWTIECNPESFTEKKAQMWLKTGVNRLSMGVQSLDPGVLRQADRIHSPETVLSVLQSEILHEFKSVSCDLIYGLPGQSVEHVLSAIREIASFDVVKHLSCYELTIAEGTPFATLASSSFPDDERLADYEYAVLREMEHRGFRRYEVSNYAKRGYECRHNITYWEMKPYLGLGPSAHSFDGVYRFANSSSLTQYVKSIGERTLPISTLDKIDTEMFRDEYLFLSLRMATGVSETKYRELFGCELYEGTRKEVIDQLVERGDMKRENGRVFLTGIGLNLADGVALKLAE